ncbi:S9 family peptidase [Colwellia hornerae]|uniref:S9 family peptidase n=1 Tax=Colwellia hornerae TaxID=89402 RepID=A0A5C6Q7U3_9GAMM|nr:S9 family peptidase [Colwellia hornerae]TWX52238.1 S9 family peptidase [Colwellia hornerae]TWX57587.1 S9 family peptidase [Colwellia hornerae]TWX64939.1 S9 family peptidase [Colwellia hornerae]
MTAPIAAKTPHLMEKHNHQRIDNYYWMRDDQRSDEKVLAHLNDENNYADVMLAKQKPLQALLFNELKDRIVKDDNTVPAKDGKYWYHSEINGEQEFSNYYRATSFAGENKTLLLDVNERAQDHEFYDLGDLSISPNDQIMSISEDTDSRRIYTVYFKDLTKSSNAPDAYLADILVETEGQVVWSNDNKTILYVKKDLETLLGTQVYRHKLGTPQADDVLVYEEDDHRFYISLDKSRDDSQLYICLHATESTHYLVVSANEPNGQFTELFPYQEQHEYHADKMGEFFYIVTNYQAKNFRLMKTTVAQIDDINNWQEIIPHRENVLLEGIELFHRFIVITERENGQIRFVVHTTQGENAGHHYPLSFDDPCYFACLDENPEPNTSIARLYYSSLTTPDSLFEFDLATGQRKLLKQQQVLGDFNQDDYQAERLFINARDGVAVPVSIVYRRSTFKKDGTNPLLQYGYGAYGLTIDPDFSSQTLSLLDRGFVYVIAHVRGSEMLGRQWYETGKKAHKQNTFNDFIDVTKALVAQGYGAKDKIFASGGSAGGLLMGAVVNQAPELYLGIGAHVPFLDVLTTMLDESIPLTTNEYDEWGDPNEAQAYQDILSYSPMDNISAQHYPNILVTTGLHDSQVQYFEPMKWVAKMRELKTDDNLLLFKTDMDAGHGGASGRFKSLKEKALEMSFFISLLNE